MYCLSLSAFCTLWSIVSQAWPKGPAECIVYMCCTPLVSLVLYIHLYLNRMDGWMDGFFKASHFFWFCTWQREQASKSCKDCGLQKNKQERVKSIRLVVDLHEPWVLLSSQPCPPQRSAFSASKVNLPRCSPAWPQSGCSTFWSGPRACVLRVWTLRLVAFWNPSSCNSRGRLCAARQESAATMWLTCRITFRPSTSSVSGGWAAGTWRRSWNAWHMNRCANK